MVELSNKQKQYLWDCLDMSEIYYGEKNNVFSDFETCKNIPWLLIPNNNEDYPYTLHMKGYGDWDDITIDLYNRINVIL